MNLVIVESPAKAKTIKKYLGPGYEVLASYGHVRDLPSKDGSVRPDDDFAMDWDVEPKAARHLKDIADAAKRADKLILATDPDREGEAISWHVLEVLKARGLLRDLPVERVSFNAVTKKAVNDAIANPRGIDRELVDAYLARRALDYLVGFTLSPVLWRKVPGSRSAGRVQSVALRLICERELEIEKFVREEYWTVEALLRTARGETFTARLVELDGDKLKKLDLKNEAAALHAKGLLERNGFTVKSLERKPARRNPPPPFITSSLQQEAARKLSLPAARTMQIAQRLYEGIDIGGETQGLITYMRTDGVQTAPEAVAEIRGAISARFGARYLPASPRLYKSKARNAQEAHEAIRPTDISRRPEDVARVLDPDQAKLYELIWKRTMASQMESAEFERTTADIDAAQGAAVLRATGSVVIFDGFLALYQEGVDDTESEDDRRLPQLSSGEPVSLVEVKPEQHFTEPPPRYSEASLVKRLEELGIGRPSTYATILSVLRDRSYVRMERGRFVPEDKGRIVTAFLEGFFRRYVEYDFTASLEEKLDLISAGELSWKDLLRDFWREFTGAVAEIKDLKISDVIDALNEILGPHIFPPQPGGGDPRRCPLCGEGQLSLKLGKFGAFIGCSNYPDCNFTRALAAGAEGASTGPKELGNDPETGEPVTLRTGRFGPYVQRGAGDNGAKPKRSKVPKDMPLDSIDLERALLLLSLPRTVGAHPETQEPIIANIGRFGPYLHHQGEYANLDSSEEMFSVGLNRAVTLLAEKKSRARPQRESKALRELGPHPEDGKAVRVMDGRYGPYVKHERINATLSKDLSPDKVTLEEALALLAARAARGGKRKTRKAKPANDDAGAKKSAASRAKKKSGKARKAKVPDDMVDSDTKSDEETGAKRTARASR